MGKLNTQNLKVLNTTTALQIIIVNWVLTTSTTNSRVSFIDLYLVFPTTFRILFLPHTNSVILLEPYCGTITEPGLPVSIRENAIFFKDNCAFSPSGHFLHHFTLPAQQFYHRSPQNKIKQNKTNTDKTLKKDRVDLIKRISKSDTSVGRNWILFWWALTNHSVNSVILDQNNATFTSAKLLIQKQFHLFANFCAVLPSSLNREKTHPPRPLLIVVLLTFVIKTNNFRVVLNNIG